MFAKKYSTSAYLMFTLMLLTTQNSVALSIGPKSGFLVGAGFVLFGVAFIIGSAATTEDTESKTAAYIVGGVMSLIGCLPASLCGYIWATDRGRATPDHQRGKLPANQEYNAESGEAA